ERRYGFVGRQELSRQLNESRFYLELGSFIADQHERRVFGSVIVLVARAGFAQQVDPRTRTFQRLRHDCGSLPRAILRRREHRHAPPFQPPQHVYSLSRRAPLRLLRDVSAVFTPRFGIASLPRRECSACLSSSWRCSSSVRVFASVASRSL